MIISQEGCGGVVGKAVVSTSEVRGSSPTPVNFFSQLFFIFLLSANAEDPQMRKTELFFAQKSSAFLLKITK